MEWYQERKRVTGGGVVCSGVLVVRVIRTSWRQRQTTATVTTNTVISTSIYWPITPLLFLSFLLSLPCLFVIVCCGGPSLSLSLLFRWFGRFSFLFLRVSYFIHSERFQKDQLFVMPQLSTLYQRQPQRERNTRLNTRTRTLRYELDY